MRIPEWRFGDILIQSGSRTNMVMFICFDRERTRMLGGGNLQFVGIHLSSRWNYQQVGAVGNYSSIGWRPIVEDRSFDDWEPLF